MIGDRNSKTRWICMFVVSPTLDWRSDASLSTCSQKDTNFSSAIPTSFSSKCVMQLDVLSSKVVSTPWEPLDLGISSPFPLNLEVVFCKISRYMLVPANSWRRRFNGGLFKDKLLRLDLLLGWGEKRKGGGWGGTCRRKYISVRHAAYLSAGIWCIRILRLEYELYEAENSSKDNKMSIIAIFCGAFNLPQYFLCKFWRYFSQKKKKKKASREKGVFYLYYQIFIT